MGGYGYRYGGMGGMGTATTTVSEYTVGTLVVDMFDAKTKNLVFRGTAEDEISDKAEKNAKKLDKAIEKLFKNFPPTAGKYLVDRRLSLISRLPGGPLRMGACSAASSDVS